MRPALRMPGVKADRPRRAATPRRRHWLAALAAALSLLAAAPAAAQAVVLVSNIGQTSATSPGSIITDHSQPFTTGSNAAGYTLSKVQFRLKRTSANSPIYTVRIYSNSGGDPDRILGTLTNPNLPQGSSFGTFDFTASGGGIDLTANTIYFVVWDVSNTNSAAGELDTTSSDSEDSGAAAGWSIANNGGFRQFDATSWTTSADSRKIAVHGTAKASNSAPTVANAIPDQTATKGAAFSYTFPANTFADADPGTTLTYTATKSDGTALPSWLTFTPGTRTFSGTPQAAGTVSVKVSASDGTASVSDTFDIVVPQDPTVDGVAISSTPLHDTDKNGTPETYGLNEKIRVQLTFSEAVTVTGTPQLTIKMDPNFGEKQANYESGSGGAVLTFAYTVVSPNISSEGVAVLADTLALNGGTIRAGQRNAELGHAGLAHDAAHKVNYTLTVPNIPPTAHAGADRTVDPGAAVTLNGSGTDSDGTIQSYAWSQVSGTSVTLQNASTARASFTAPATPGALVFRLTVTDDSGDTGTDDVTVTVRDAPPRFVSTVATLRLEPGEAMTPVVLPAATGGNGGPYTYALASDPAGLAGLAFNAATRTLSGTPNVERRRWTFTYTAHDGDANTAASDAARLTFRVTVGVVIEEQRRVLRHTLAAVATRTAAAALANIGTRLDGGPPAAGLTLAGETVPLGAAPAAGLADGPEDGLEAGLADGRRSCPAAVGRRLAAPGMRGCAPGAGSRGVDADALWLGSAFSLALGAAEGEPGFDPQAPRWGAWGRGDFGSFSGRPDAVSRYEGETRTGWLGLDARAGRWVAGLAVSRGWSETDYALETDRGRVETALTALWPYGRWTFADGLEVRGVLGAGRGEARHVPEGDGAREKSRLTMWMGSVGLKQALPPLAGIALAARGDASFTRMATAKGAETVGGLRADAWRLRGGVEASRRFALADGSSLAPFLEAAARRDDGDGLTGTGVELAGGLRYAAAGVSVEARGRWLATHSEDSTREHGVSVTARVGPGAQGRGLSFSLSPRWGAGAGRVETLWRHDMPQQPDGEAGASVDARLAYGFALASGRLLTPFAETGLAEDEGRHLRVGARVEAPGGVFTPFAETGLAGGENRHLRVGTRFETPGAALGAELSGERRENGAAGPEHALRLDISLRF